MDPTIAINCSVGIGAPFHRAHAGYYKLAGTVRDADSNPYQALVVVRESVNPGSRAIRGGATDANGDFEFENLKAGEYTILAFDFRSGYNVAGYANVDAVPM